MKLRTVVLTICFVFAALVAETSAQTRVVTGQVTDAASGGGIDGARVMIRGTNISATTEADGTFTIGVPAGEVEIVIARIGYKRALIVLGGTRNTVQVTLEADVFELEEIVVTGRGTGIERRNLANAVATVSGANITRVAAQSIEHALQGRVAGADIQTNSGAPGGGAQIRLRGVTTLSASASPLYVVDGVIISNVAIPSNQNAVTRASGGSNASSTQDGQVNRIVDLNPNDIESIEILKGASASAIYGSKASNGVIIITTKRGRSGRPQVRVSQKFGYFDLSNKLGFRPFADAAAVDAALGAGTAASVGFTGQTFDYEQQLYGRNALSFETQLSASGGDDNTTYFISGLWKEDEGIAENTGFDKQSLRVNIDQEFSDRLSASVSTNILHTLARRGLQNNDNAGVSPYMVFPFTPNIVDLRRRADGTFPDNPFERSNPLATMARLKNDEDVWRLIASGRIEYNAIQSTNHSLDVIGQGGIDFFRQQNDLFFPPDLQFEDDDGFAGTSLLTNSDNTNINLNTNLVHTYTPSGGGTVFTTSTGVTYETRELTTASIQSQGQIAGQEGIAAGVKSTLNEIRQRAEDFGFYLQEEVLTFDERLLLTAGIRGDQTSRNSEDDKVFYYPKAAASFRFPDLGGFVDELKIRTAYGETGNQPLFGQKFTPLGATSNIEGIPGILILGNVGSTDLKPERQREIEGGFDALLFGGRATLEFTLFQKNVSDLIITRALAASSGFANQIFNGAKLRTRGAEAAFGIVPIQTQNVNWLLRTTFGLTRSKITELQVPAFIPANAGFGVGLGSFKIEEGKSATQIVGNLADGSGVGQIGDANPDFKIGISNDITIGDFSVFAHGDWQKGGDIVNLTQLLYDAGGNSIDFDAAGSDRISNFGGDTKIYVQDASFFKMREVSLAWQLPTSVTSSIWGALQDARLSLSARNLFTITDYAGTDPEVSNFGNQSVGRNIDVAPFPPSRSFWFSIDVGF